MSNNSIAKVYLRFHARLILGTVALFGFSCNFVLLKFLKIDIWIRYPLAAFFSYIVFIFLMLMWKKYIEGLPPVRNESEVESIVTDSKRKWIDYLDVPDLGNDWEGILIAIFVVAFFIILVYVSSFLIFELPVMMIDLIMASAVSSVLYRPIQKADDNIFVFKVFRQTVWPGICLILLYFIIGKTIYYVCPTATKIGEAFSGSCYPP